MRAGTVQSCRLVATNFDVVKDLLRTEVLGGRAEAWAGAGHGRAGDPAEPDWGALGQLPVCLRESELDLGALNFRTCIGATATPACGMAELRTDSR